MCQRRLERDLDRRCSVLLLARGNVLAGRAAASRIAALFGPPKPAFVCDDLGLFRRRTQKPVAVATLNWVTAYLFPVSNRRIGREWVCRHPICLGYRANLVACEARYARRFPSCPSRLQAPGPAKNR